MYSLMNDKKVNTRLLEAIVSFPQPQNVSKVRRFLGLLAI